MAMKLVSLILIFLIIALLFGTKKLRNMGEGLAEAFKSFRKGLNEDGDNKPDLR